MYDHDKLNVQTFLNKKDLDNEIIDLIKEKELKVDDYAERVKICDDIREVLVEAGFTSCLVYPYGSTINSVGFTDSDLDLYVDLQISQNTTLKIAKILENCSQFVDIKAVPNARVPIVKAVHFLSGIKCDISFEHRASLWNTEFIRFCCLHDPRVRPLIMLVRYWGRVHGLVGRDGQVRLCNYALTLMVIAYLQQIPCPILHSVQELLTITDVDIHPSSFCSFLLAKQGMLPLLLKNTDNLTDLLMGFFHHYHGYDFAKNVISIFLGRTIGKEQLILGNNYRITKPVCLQDPFELNFNICRNMNTKALAAMKCRFYDAFKKTRALLSGEECDSLAALLLTPSPHPSPLPDCNGCHPSPPTQPQWMNTSTCYPEPMKIPQCQYIPTIQEYNLQVLRCSIAQKMPPWWKKWRGFS